jgi:hypothetical protein
MTFQERDGQDKLSFQTRSEWAHAAGLAIPVLRRSESWRAGEWKALLVGAGRFTRADAIHLNTVARVLGL